MLRRGGLGLDYFFGFARVHHNPEDTTNSYVFAAAIRRIKSSCVPAFSAPMVHESRMPREGANFSASSSVAEFFDVKPSDDAGHLKLKSSRFNRVGGSSVRRVSLGR